MDVAPKQQITQMEVESGCRVTDGSALFFQLGITAIFTIHPIFELSSLASLIALGMRNQICLRSIMLAAYALHVADDYLTGGIRLWDHIVWNCVFLIFNTYILACLVYGRTVLGLCMEKKALFSLFLPLSPGEFRKLLRSAVFRTAEVETVLTTEGFAPDRLYFVYEGDITLDKRGIARTIKPLTFIGEIAFLRRSTASATVTLAPGARWIEWSATGLRDLLARDASLRSGFSRMIEEDLAEKVVTAS